MSRNGRNGTGAAPAFPKITVWHSALRAACGRAEGGRLRIQRLGPVRDSDYSNRPRYVEFHTDQDPTPRKYQIETPEIAALIEAIPEGVSVWIEAGGSRTEPTLRAWTDTGAPIRPGVPVATAAPETEGAAATADDTPAAARDGRETIEVDYWGCLLVARRMVARYERLYGRAPTDEELRVANGLHIQRNKENGRRPLTRRMPTAESLKQGPPEREG